ncbi:hypothetical protein ACOMHN_055153 [Nucella lapillus]
MLILNGYHFRLDRHFNNRTAWKCKVGGCRGRCMTNTADKITRVTERHNHPVDWTLLRRQFQLSDEQVAFHQGQVQPQFLSVQPVFYEQLEEDMDFKIKIETD